MGHTITLTDEQYARLQAVARHAQKTAEDVLTEWLDSLPASVAPTGSGMTAAEVQVSGGTTTGSPPPIADEEYTQRWAAFWPLVGSITHGQALGSDDIEELIGEEAADAHAEASS